MVASNGHHFGVATMLSRMTNGSHMVPPNPGFASYYRTLLGHMGDITCICGVRANVASFLSIVPIGPLNFTAITSCDFCDHRVTITMKQDCNCTNTHPHPHSEYLP